MTLLFASLYETHSLGPLHVLHVFCVLIVTRDDNVQFHSHFSNRNNEMCIKKITENKSFRIDDFQLTADRKENDGQSEKECVRVQTVSMKHL